MRLTINGVPRDVDVAGHETLAALLRDRLGLTGTKVSCARGECGACTVLLQHGAAEPRTVYSCLTLAASCEAAVVTTIEGLGAAGIHPLQKAFVARDAVQCGYCTPGQILAAMQLLQDNNDPTEQDIRVALSGNLCRCGAQPGIVAAVQDAAARLQTAAP